jgi:hypothetical protein
LSILQPVLYDPVIVPQQRGCSRKPLPGQPQ